MGNKGYCGKNVVTLPSRSTESSAPASEKLPCRPTFMAQAFFVRPQAVPLQAMWVELCPSDLFSCKKHVKTILCLVDEQEKCFFLVLVCATKGGQLVVDSYGLASEMKLQMANRLISHFASNTLRLSEQHVHQKKEENIRKRPLAVCPHCLAMSQQ